MQSTENLDGLLQRIRNEGIERARHDAEEILAAARQQADALLKSAEVEAEQLVREANRRAADIATASRAAREQAARDLVLTVRSQLIAQLDRIIGRSSLEAMGNGALLELIRATATTWCAGNPGQTIEIQIDDKDRAKLADAFLARLSDELRAGVELAVCPGLPGGFRIGNRGGSMVWDCSAASLAEALASLLRPEFAQALKPLIQPGHGG